MTAHRRGLEFSLLAVLTVAAAPAAGGRMSSPNHGDEGTLHVLVGGTTPLLLSLDVASNQWRRLDVATAAIGPGEALAHVVNGADYGLAGGGSTAFFSAAGTRGATVQLADAPAPVSEGGALTAAPGLVGAPSDHLYAVRGDGTRDFWRYSIGDNAWTVMPDTPAGLGEGGALVEYSSKSHSGLCRTSSYGVAALRGGGTADFWCFNIDHHRWEAGPPTPAPVGAGGALAQMQGEGYLYALRGGGTRDFWRIDPDGRWVACARTPGPVQAGGALVAVNYGTRSQRQVLFALPGGGSNAVWRYDVKADTWTQLSTVPEALERVAGSPIR